MADAEVEANDPGLYGLKVIGSGGVGDHEARARVKAVLTHISEAAGQGGQASAAFIQALRNTSDIHVHVNRSACAAYSSSFPEDSIKIHPTIESKYERTTPGGRMVMPEDFEAILVHELMHKLPQLDFPANPSGTFKGPLHTTSTWNAPAWSPNSPPIGSEEFAKAYYGEGARAAVYAKLMPERAQEHAMEELRAVRGTNAVMSEVREHGYYFPRRYYADPSLENACTNPDGSKIPGEEHGIRTDAKILLNKSLDDVKGKIDHLREDAPVAPPGKDAPAVPNTHGGNAGSLGYGLGNADFPGSNTLQRAYGQIAADHVVMLAAQDSNRPAAAQDVINAKILENIANNAARGEQYAVHLKQQVSVEVGEIADISIERT